MAEESLEALAERVRGGLGAQYNVRSRRRAALAALATLLQRVKEAERANQTARVCAAHLLEFAGDGECLVCEVEAVEARERELREALKAIANDYVQKDWIVEHAREALHSLDSEVKAS